MQEEHNKLEIGEIVIIDGIKEYTVIKEKENKYLLLSNNEPLNIIIGYYKDNKIEVINNKKEILKMISCN